MVQNKTNLPSEINSCYIYIYKLCYICAIHGIIFVGVTFLSALKQMNLHVQYQSGPLLAVDVKNNIDLHWRAHGVPLRSRKSAVANLHYISNEIDGLAGGPHTVIMFNLGPHFTTYPLDFYTHRVLRIRKAILLDRILRWAFQDVGVYILDVWQMTACHYSKENIHLCPVIIKNEIDILLSFICPVYI
uniref:NXPE C-terminal domain-containing protein n=1 Tax=Sinocyclocheilus rhinocerous TaxID=307959 RepID=A0A673IRL9_9TELE